MDYNEIENRINNDILERRKQLEVLYQTIKESEEYGYHIAFEANTPEEGYKSAFMSGRTIGQVEGEIDQLESFLNFIYREKNGIGGENE